MFTADIIAFWSESCHKKEQAIATIFSVWSCARSPSVSFFCAGSLLSPLLDTLTLPRCCSEVSEFTIYFSVRASLDWFDDWNKQTKPQNLPTMWGLIMKLLSIVVLLKQNSR